jgi:hypothetical protein
VNANTGVQATRTSANDGYATFTPVVRGTYSLEVTASGFQKSRVNALTLDVDEQKLVRFKLQVAGVSETVDVTAAAPTIQSEQGSLGQVIQGKRPSSCPSLRVAIPNCVAPGAHLDITTRGTRLVRRQRQLPDAEQLRARRRRQQPGHYQQRAVAFRRRSCSLRPTQSASSRSRPIGDLRSSAVSPAPPSTSC